MSGSAPVINRLGYLPRFGKEAVLMSAAARRLLRPRDDMAGTSGNRKAPAKSRNADLGDEWLTAVARAAAKDSHVPPELLGEYLTMLADAAVHGRRARPEQLSSVRQLGQRAAEQGVGAGQAVELYLSAAWRLWRELPLVVRSRDREHVRAAAEAVLRVLNDAVGVFVESHQAA